MKTKTYVELGRVEEVVKKFCGAFEAAAIQTTLRECPDWLRTFSANEAEAEAAPATVYWVGHSDTKERLGEQVSVQPWRQNQASFNTAGASGFNGRGPVNGSWANAEWIPCSDGKSRPAQPGAAPLVDGFAGRVGRIRAYGNALVAAQAETFIKAYLETLWSF